MEATVTDHRIAGVPGLVGALDELDLRLLGAGAEEERHRLRSLVAGYLLPRREAPDGPLVVAVVGETGSGKSTIVNSLARHRVTATGSLRPTTTRGVVWTAEPLPATLDQLRGDDGLAVVTEGSGLPEGIIVVDTPPPGYSGLDGTSIASAVLDRADVCLLVASGLRYADVGVWALLRRAVRRRLPIVVVLNRLPEDPGVQEAVAGDMARRLVDIGAAAEPARAPLVTVAEGPIVSESGGLPPEWVARVRKELDALGDLASRRATISRALQAARRDVERGLLSLREAMVDASLVRGELLSSAGAAYEHQAAQFGVAVREGDFSGIGLDREVLTTDLAAVVAWRSNLASRRAAEAWQAIGAGSRLLDEIPTLWMHGADVLDAARARFDDWYRGLGDLVLDTLGRRRMRRRPLAHHVTLVAAGALDPEHHPQTRRGRKRRARLGDAPETARRWLEQIGEELLANDAARFSDALGTAPTGDVLRRLVMPDARRDG